MVWSMAPPRARATIEAEGGIIVSSTHPRNPEREKPMATRDQVRTAMRAQPFRPFAIKLADGRQFRIDHPEFIAVSPNGREMVIYDDEGMSLIEMLMVVEVRMTRSPEQAPEPEPTAGEPSREEP
jgi:hypothetical protein